VGQSECLKFTSNKKYELTREIAERLGQRPAIVSISLGKLFHQGLVFRKSVVERGHRMYRWKKR
jgi:Mn-dependent DtxR family transcriptional regulator